MVNTTDDAMDKLLQELSDAKTWPARFQRSLDKGAEVGREIWEADRTIEALENRAKEAIKRFGCVHPETRTIHNRMVDMLISWQTFKDSLEQ
jgi:hypothetical protein